MEKLIKHYYGKAVRVAQVVHAHAVTRWHHFKNDQTGASVVEYSLLVSLIAIGALVAIQALGGNVAATLQSAATAIGGGGTP